MNDEKILDMKKQKRMAEKQAAETNEKEEQLENELKMSIYDGIIDIFGVPTEFNRRMLLEEKLSIYMPISFEQMPDEVVKTVYYAGNPPQCLYSNASANFSIGFNMTEHNVDNEHIYEFAVGIRNVLKKVTPGGMKLLDTTKWNYQVYNIVGLEFLSESLSGSVYNLMFFSSVNGKIVIGTINFATKDRRRLAPLAQEIAQSYEIHAVADMVEETEPVVSEEENP